MLDHDCWPPDGAQLCTPRTAADPRPTLAARRTLTLFDTCKTSNWFDHLTLAVLFDYLLLGASDISCGVRWWAIVGGTDCSCRLDYRPSTRPTWTKAELQQRLRVSASGVPRAFTSSECVVDEMHIDRGPIRSCTGIFCLFIGLHLIEFAPDVHGKFWSPVYAQCSGMKTDYRKVRYAWVRLFLRGI